MCVCVFSWRSATWTWIVQTTSIQIKLISLVVVWSIVSDHMAWSSGTWFVHFNRLFYTYIVYVFTSRRVQIWYCNMTNKYCVCGFTSINRQVWWWYSILYHSDASFFIFNAQYWFSAVNRKSDWRRENVTIRRWVIFTVNIS